MTPSPFDEHHLAYDAWFDRFPFVHAAELRAIRALLPGSGVGLEVGVGSGRFAAPLQVGIGIDPSLAMLALAQGRGVAVMGGRAEALPIKSGALDFLLLVTVLCFLEEPLVALREARRVVKSGGRMVLAFIDRQSPLGQENAARQQESLFYRDARFYRVDEVLALCREAGFLDELTVQQTLFAPLNEIGPNEPLQTGWGQGGFVVLAAS